MTKAMALDSFLSCYFYAFHFLMIITIFWMTTNSTNITMPSISLDFQPQTKLITSHTIIDFVKHTLLNKSSVVATESASDHVVDMVSRKRRRKKKLLILDVNGLLADIVQPDCATPEIKPDRTISRKAVFKRPFCDDFMRFCFHKCNVGVWSSMNRDTMMVLHYLVPDFRDKLLFLWDRSYCTFTSFTTFENENKPLVLKELEKLWEQLEIDLPGTRGKYNESNTLMLDNSPCKALRNPPNIAIFPYPYHFNQTTDTSILGSDGDILSYLQGVAMANNVHKYVEQHPFGQPPITNSSPSWGFYRPVIEDEVPK